MTWLVESFWPAVTLGLVLEIALAIVLVRTGRVVAVVAMGLVLLATIGMVALEWAVVTQTEEVEYALWGAASAMESNDPAAVLAFFSENSRRRAEVESALARFTVGEVRVGGDLRIATNPLTNPPSATAIFTGRVNAHDNRREVPYDNMVRRFKVTLHNVQDRWLIHEVEMAQREGGRWTRGRIRAR